MRFAILMFTDPARTEAMTKAEFDQVMAKHAKLHEEFLRPGELLNGAGLRDPRETTTLRLEGDETVATTGPLAPAPLHLSAYHVMECESRERATEIAEYILDFHVEAVEIREIHDTANM